MQREGLGRVSPLVIRVFARRNGGGVGEGASLGGGGGFSKREIGQEKRELRGKALVYWPRGSSDWTRPVPSGARMSERTRATIALWRLDTELQRAETLVASLTAQLGDQVKVKAADLATRRAHEGVARAKAAQKDAEFALAQLEARIKEHDTLLWSGKGSPRDLEALRVELERENVRRAALEEAALGAMEVTARAERDAARVESNVAKALADLKAGNAARVAERTDAVSRRAEATKQREALVASMDPADVATYERIRSRIGDGVPVAELSGSRCEGCRTDLPTGFVQRVRREPAPLPCPSCGRLLHALA